MSQISQYSKTRIAITVAFIINGYVAGSFYARIADIKSRLEITNSALGIALLCIAIGVLIGLGFSGRQSAKRGSAPIVVASTYAIAVSVLIVGLTNSFITLCTAFVFFGACLSIQDVAMNSHAIVLEHEADKRYMSTFHAMFSIGTLSGGISGGVSSHYEISFLSQSLVIAILIVIANFFVRNSFLPATIDQHPLTKKKNIRRPKIFLVVGLLGLCAALSEGSAGDWGAVLARDTFDATPFISTLPYICFSAAMVIGRLMGDRLAAKFGPMKLIIGGGLIAGIGLASGLIVGGVGGVIFGWLAIGIGFSTVIPMLFSQAGEIAKSRPQLDFAPSEAVATVSGIAYFGFLAGPPLLGFLGDLIGLRWAMMIPAILAIAMALSARPVLGNK
jgi:MFS family permease